MKLTPKIGTRVERHIRSSSRNEWEQVDVTKEVTYDSKDAERNIKGLWTFRLDHPDYDGILIPESSTTEYREKLQELMKKRSMDIRA